MRRSALVMPVVLMLASPSAFAQSAGDKATAEALFGDGRRLMAQGNYRDACPKFEASVKLDPGVGAILNLADCYEKNGQTASAWAEFREASAAARAAGSKDREDLAR
jgi:Tfp pilus assembly protein PilF